LGVASLTPQHPPKIGRQMAYSFTPEKTDLNEFGATPAGSTEATKRKLLNLRPSKRFYYIHHPDAWQLIETDNGFEWLPLLRAFRITAGVNGVRLTGGKNPRPDDRNARVNLTDRGFTIIPYESIEGGYCWRYAGKRGPIYLERWAVPKQVGNRTIIKSDSAGLHAYMRHLIEANYIELPDPDVLEIIGQQLEQTIERDEPNLHIPSVAKRHSENQRRLEGMATAAEKIFAEPKKTPKKKAKK